MGAGLVVLLVLLWLAGFPTWLGVVCVVMYFGACGSILRVVPMFMSEKYAVTLISAPDPERENETREERRARWDHDAAVEIAKLGPEFLPVVEPEPLEQDLADEAARIDAAHAAAPRAASERPEYERAEEEELERAKVTCVNCGELNQRDFGRCWNCESVL